MESIFKIFDLACSGFWPFIGVSLLCSMFLYFGVNGILNAWSKLLSRLAVYFRGWPPTHLDADGDFQDKEAKTTQEPKTVSPSEHDVKMHCVNTNGREYMCKTCGRTFDALATARHYCDNCGCWICPSCATKNNSCISCLNKF